MSEFDAKTVFLGAAGVGKTSIIHRAVSNSFGENLQPSPSACVSSMPIAFQDHILNLQIWDTAGQERFRAMAPLYYRGAVVAVIVFSLAEAPTIDDVRGWADEVRGQGDSAPVLFIVGNKLDLVADIPTLTPDGKRKGESLASSMGAIYIEVSAKSAQGIEGLFVQIAEEAHKRLCTSPQRPSRAGGVEIGPTPRPGRKRKFC
jgi:Ras-related protein Rab-22